MWLMATMLDSICLELMIFSLVDFFDLFFCTINSLQEMSTFSYEISVPVKFDDSIIDIFKSQAWHVHAYNPSTSGG